MTTCLRKELFIRFTERVIRERLSNFVCDLLSVFGIEARMRYVIVLILDHCLSFYLDISIA